MNGCEKAFVNFAGVVLAASMFSAFAQPNCNVDSFETPDWLICSQEIFDSLDAALNDQYKKAQASLAPDNRKLLVDVQRSWVKFKEEYCETLYQKAEAGETAALKKWSCLLHTTNGRLNELIYLQTGMTNDGFYNATLAMVGKDKAMTKEAAAERLAGEVLVDPIWQHYVAGHCEMAYGLFREDLDLCGQRMRFQLPINR
ncbi:lysozyme inhibitor LprI family protein [Pseudomonas frederiksbergensis]|uniref:lysozyme inhibitor LprI family protein n=1 Tax=Pseudomonas frederiksbergensis TaxID=104087 RepID=UPI003D1AA275